MDMQSSESKAVAITPNAAVYCPHPRFKELRQELDKISFDLLRTMAKRLIGFSSDCIVEPDDLIQEAFIAAVGCGFSDYRQNYNVAQYLYFKMLMIRRTYWRTTKRLPVRLLENADDVAAKVDTEPSNALMLRHLPDAIAALRPSYQQVIHLKYYENLSFREIGRRLQITEIDVNNWVRRAREAIREFISSRCINEED